MTTEPKTYDTTAKHFELFKAEAQRFINLFGLWDWRVDFRHDETEEHSNAQALCEFHTGDQHVANLVLSTDFHEEITPEKISRAAFHEVCHILLADAHNISSWADMTAGQRFDATNAAHHAIIRRLENTVLPKL